MMKNLIKKRASSDFFGEVRVPTTGFEPVNSYENGS